MKRINPTLLKRAREMRREPSLAEKMLWNALANKQLVNYKFRRQHVIGSYIVDFYCPECSLIIEIDGDSHAGQVSYDQARTDWLVSQGYHIIRFTNDDVISNLDSVLVNILEEIEKIGELF